MEGGGGPLAHLCGPHMQTCSSRPPTQVPPREGGSHSTLRSRAPPPPPGTKLGANPDGRGEEIRTSPSSWRRVLLLIIAITIHNIPGELFHSAFEVKHSFSWTHL